MKYKGNHLPATVQIINHYIRADSPMICKAAVSHPISTAPAMTHYRQLPDVISYFIFHVIFYTISCRFIYKRVARTISSINSSALRLMRIATAMSREVSSRGLSPIYGL